MYLWALYNFAITSHPTSRCAVHLWPIAIIPKRNVRSISFSWPYLLAFQVCNHTFMLCPFVHITLSFLMFSPDGCLQNSPYFIWLGSDLSHTCTRSAFDQNICHFDFQCVFSRYHFHTLWLFNVIDASLLVGIGLPICHPLRLLITPVQSPLHVDRGVSLAETFLRCTFRIFIDVSFGAIFRSFSDQSIGKTCVPLAHFPLSHPPFLALTMTLDTGQVSSSYS